MIPPFYADDKEEYCKAFGSEYVKDGKIDVNSKGKIVYIPPHCSRKNVVKAALNKQLEAGAKLTTMDPALCSLLGRKFVLERSGVNIGKGYCSLGSAASGKSSRRSRKSRKSRKSRSSRKSRKSHSKKHVSKKSHSKKSHKVSKKSRKSSKKSRKSRKH